eukprot:15459537-Alexandrium_andersonii.AAC.1
MTHVYHAVRFDFGVALRDAPLERCSQPLKTIVLAARAHFSSVWGQADGSTDRQVDRSADR